MSQVQAPISQESHQEIFLKDYQPSNYLIKTVNLCFELSQENTLVHAEISFYQNPNGDKSNYLKLDGENLKLIIINNQEIGCEYQQENNQLKLANLPKEFVLKTTVEINPKANTELTGLYLSNNIFCTQCESEGFRKITYFLDRPDVLAIYTVKIIAAKKAYPVLLGNGNLIESGDLKNQKHYAVWHDPFNKPCYLFALVAGDLGFIQDEFKTKSNKCVKLYIYSEHQNIDQCDHAMSSLKKSMKWDEENYGLEYDLEIFNIVAVNDFVFGAMENKSLNIFNAKYILAKPETATDQNYADIDTVVGHEYFHNWSGNRVTCRDWFQLSLKEGLTVFREQCFDEDNVSKTVHRIRKVQDLRNSQFQEDAGPMAHPVRPESYITIDNFYTRTVYNKGSELIRMFKLLLGDKNYRKATEYYFNYYDGQAVTTDDFFGAMQKFCERDLSQFKLWYSQAGTPEVSVKSEYDAEKKQYKLSLKQSHQNPMLIPIKLDLLNLSNGKPENLNLENNLILLSQLEQEFVFENITSPVVPSLLQFFSAPVKLSYDYSDDELLFLMQHDPDGFNQWEAGQRYAAKLILADKNNLESTEKYCQAFEKILVNNYQDKLFQAELLTPPSEQSLFELFDLNKFIELDKVITQRDDLILLLALRFEQDFLKIYNNLNINKSYEFTVEQCGERALKNLCLSYLVKTSKQIYINLAMEQFKHSLKNNMTDCLAALTAMASIDCLERVEALSLFEDQWREEALVINKWFTVQATSRLSNSLENIKTLMQQDLFNIKNPNNVYALICAFAMSNARNFHNLSGEGYGFLADTVITLDKINPMVAARAVEPLLNFKRFDQQRQKLMQAQLENIMAVKDLSNNVYEGVSRALGQVKV